MSRTAIYMTNVSGQDITVSSNSGHNELEEVGKILPPDGKVVVVASNGDLGAFKDNIGSITISAQTKDVTPAESEIELNKRIG